MAGDETSGTIDGHLRRPWRERSGAAARQTCCWPGCLEDGSHRAPRSRDQLRQFQWFCLEHVREYNRGWDYFSGMSQAEIEAHRRADVTWHRPTWRFGGAWAGPEGMRDPFELFADERPPPRPAPERADARVVTMMALLGLEPGFSVAELKQRFKLLVKRYHPDLHGGDKSCEEQLRAVIEAYRFLRDQGRPSNA